MQRMAEGAQPCKHPLTYTWTNQHGKGEKCALCHSELRYQKGRSADHQRIAQNRQEQDTMEMQLIKDLQAKALDAQVARCFKLSGVAAKKSPPPPPPLGSPAAGYPQPPPPPPSSKSVQSRAFFDEDLKRVAHEVVDIIDMGCKLEQGTTLRPAVMAAKNKLEWLLMKIEAEARYLEQVNAGLARDLISKTYGTLDDALRDRPDEDAGFKALVRIAKKQLEEALQLLKSD